jgi:hypothetical protein
MSIKKGILISFTFLIFTMSASAQTDDLTKMLDKALNEVEASRAVIKAQQAEIEAWKRVDLANQAVSEAKDKIILAKDKQIETLTALKCNKTSFLFGLISKKTCY